MFSSFKAGTNPFDASVDKATDEAQTSESWDLLLTICDKVDLEGESGARNVIQSLQRRLAHRSANVQLYSLTLADALVSNCKAPLHREVASASFMESIKRLVTDRTSHEKVKKRAFLLLRKWAGEFERDERLGLVEDAYQSLLSKGIRYEEDSAPPVAARVDENALARKEEEDIQRAIRESEMEAQRAATRYNTGYTAPSSQPSTSYAPARADGYTPTPDKPLPQPASVAPALSTPPVSQQPKPNVRPPIPRARALYDFDPDPNQPGELPLRKGDIVRVLDKTYAEWWRGECKGRVGIFPCNWVEPLPDLSEDQLLAEARSEAAVFAQVGNVDRLLELLRKADATPNPMTAISDDDEVTELYQQCLSLRPKVVKLIDKYASRREELLDMNTKFVEAKRAYEMMLDESWARHNAQQQQAPAVQPQGYPGAAAPPQGYYYPQQAYPSVGVPANQPPAGYYQQPAPVDPAHMVYQGAPMGSPEAQQPISRQTSYNANAPVHATQAPQIAVSSPPPPETYVSPAPAVQPLPNPYTTHWPAPVPPHGVDPQAPNRQAYYPDQAQMPNVAGMQLSEHQGLSSGQDPRQFVYGQPEQFGPPPHQQQAMPAQ